MPERPTGGPRANPKSKGPREPQDRAPKTEPTSSLGAPRQKPTSKKPQEQEPPPTTANPRTRERLQKAQSRPRERLPGRSLSQMRPPTPMRTSPETSSTPARRPFPTPLQNPPLRTLLLAHPAQRPPHPPSKPPADRGKRRSQGKPAARRPSWTAGDSLEKPTPTPSQQEASPTDPSSPKPTPTPSRKPARRGSQTKPPQQPRSKAPSRQRPSQKPLPPQRSPRPLPQETHP